MSTDCVGFTGRHFASCWGRWGGGALSGELRGWPVAVDCDVDWLQRNAILVEMRSVRRLLTSPQEAVLSQRTCYRSWKLSCERRAQKNLPGESSLPKCYHGKYVLEVRKESPCNPERIHKVLCTYVKLNSFFFLSSPVLRKNPLECRKNFIRAKGLESRLLNQTHSGIGRFGASLSVIGTNLSSLGLRQGSSDREFQSCARMGPAAYLRADLGARADSSSNARFS